MAWSCGHAAPAPAGLGLEALDAGQGEPRPVGILERERRCAEALDGRVVGDALLDQALGPVTDRALRNAEHGLLRFADAEPSGRGPLPGEKGEDRARMAGRVAVIEVIGAGIVEIDRLLHQAQAKRARVEIEVPARGACDARHMMDAARHASLPFAVETSAPRSPERRAIVRRCLAGNQPGPNRSKCAGAPPGYRARMTAPSWNASRSGAGMNAGAPIGPSGPPSRRANDLRPLNAPVVKSAIG